MTFYSYGLTEERASTLSYGVSLSATNAETASESAHINGWVLLLGAADAQAVATVAKAIGKILLSASTESVHLAITSFHSYFKALSAASTEAVSVARVHLASAFLQAASSDAAGLVMAKPFHAVVAAQQANARKLVKAMGRSFARAQTNQAALSNFTGHFRSLAAASSEAGSSSRGSAIARGAIGTSSALLLWGWGHPFLAVNASIASRVVALAKAFGASDSESASLNRTRPQHSNATSSEAAGLNFGGGNLYQRVFGAASAEALTLARSMAAQRQAISASAVGLAKTTGKALGSVASSSLSTLYKVLLRSLNAVSGSAVALSRQMSLPRGALSASVAFASEAAAHLLAALHAASAQAASVFEQHARPAVLSAAEAQTASVARNPLRTLLAILSAVNAQSATLSRFMARSLAAASPGVAGMVRTVIALRALSAASSQLAASQRLIGKLLAAISGSIGATRASHGRTYGTASAEVTTSIAHHGTFLAVMAANAAALAKGAAKVLALTSGQATSFARLIGKIQAVASTEAAALARGMYRFPAVISAEVATSVARHGSSIAGIVSASATSMLRSTAKMLGAGSAQASASGRIDFKRLGAVSTNVAQLLKPRGFALRAAQAQVASAVSWYHLFVAAWNYQQTTLLPPSGGPAEPPSFGPIDPADQTTFAFDWSARADAGDPIASAAVVSVPPGLVFTAAPVFVSGTLVQVTVGPSPQAYLPMTYRLRCTCTFVSGRRSSFSIPVPVRTL